MLSLPNTEFDSKTSNGLSKEGSLLDKEETKTISQPKSEKSQIKPLGDISIKLEDIVPCMYS